MFEQMKVISTYSRAEAIADGVLHDVSEMASQAGFKVPVAITVGVEAVLNDIPVNHDYQCRNGRLWDTLTMLFNAIKGGCNRVDVPNCPRRLVYFDLIMHTGNSNASLQAIAYNDFNCKARGYRLNHVRFKSHIGPGDNGEPVITIMLPNED